MHGLPHVDKQQRTCIAHGLPCGNRVRLACGLDGQLEVAEVHQTQGELGVVADVIVDDSCGLVQFVIEAPAQQSSE